VPPVRLPPQPLGAQTEEVLRELGYTQGEIDKLASEKIIGIAAGEK
jgi:crotonobetainyl-CoA:carnitine CoA-transferase CaiB-like acyl-CoA transferase